MARGTQRVSLAAGGEAISSVRVARTPSRVAPIASLSGAPSGTGGVAWRLVGPGSECGFPARIVRGVYAPFPPQAVLGPCFSTGLASGTVSHPGQPGSPGSCPWTRKSRVNAADRTPRQSREGRVGSKTRHECRAEDRLRRTRAVNGPTRCNLHPAGGSALPGFFGMTTAIVAPIVMSPKRSKMSGRQSPILLDVCKYSSKLTFYATGGLLAHQRRLLIENALHNTQRGYINGTAERAVSFPMRYRTIAYRG